MKPVLAVLLAAITDEWESDDDERERGGEGARGRPLLVARSGFLFGFRFPAFPRVFSENSLSELSSEA